MSIQIKLPETFSAKLRAQDDGSRMIGAWVTSGSATNAEIISNAGFDWVLLDAEHAPYGLETVLELLRAVGQYSVTPVVRLPNLDTVLIKQYLDLGAQNLMIPMVDTAEQAAQAVAAMHYPPRGVRGVGSALARSSRWNGVPNYLQNASETVSVTVQIESHQAVENASEICEVEGVDQIFVGPSDLAASMGLLGEQTHPDVVEAVHEVFGVAKKFGKPVGVNAFDVERAKQYLDAGADFALVGADVQLLAQSAQMLASNFKT